MVSISACAAFSETPGLSFRNDVVTVKAPVLHKFRCQCNRRIDFGAFRIIEVRRQHANHCANDTVSRNRLIDNIRIGAETTLPKAVGDDGDAILAGLVLFLNEVAAP
jgi:hypothetical protein